MHERSLMTDLMRKIESAAAENGSGRVKVVTVRLGALSHFSAEHFREHFEDVSRGTVAEGARLDVTLATDPGEPRAMDVLLEGLELEVDG